METLFPFIENDASWELGVVADGECWMANFEVSRIVPANYLVTSHCFQAADQLLQHSFLSPLKIFEQNSPNFPFFLPCDNNLGVSVMKGRVDTWWWRSLISVGDVT